MRFERGEFGHDYFVSLFEPLAAVLYLFVSIFFFRALATTCFSCEG
jgi:hypothetical protein